MHKRKKSRNKKSVILPKIQIADNFFEKNLDKCRKKEYNFYRLAYANCIKTIGVNESMNLWQAEIGTEYIVDRIESGDEDMESFLFSLGCYGGEPITVISKKKKTLVASIKDGRYSMDRALAEAIFLK